MPLTPLMRYRATPLAAPLAVMAPVQGKADGLVGDVLSYSRGTQVVGNVYDTANTNQGTCICLFEPLYVGNDSLTHYPWAGGSLAYVQKRATNVLRAVMATSQQATVDSAAISSALLTRLLSVTRFDADNAVSGSAVIDHWLNGVQALGGSGVQTVGAPSTGYLGSNNGQNAGHLMYAAYNVEYPQTDAQIAALGTGTSPVSPDRVLLHPELIKFGWQPGLRAASGSFSGSLTNEGFFINHRPYDVSTNPNGDLLATNGMFETAAHVASWTAVDATLSLDTTAADLAGLFDTGCLKVEATGDADGHAYIDLPFAAASKAYISAFCKKGTADTGARVRVWSGTSGSEETTLLFDSTVTTNATPVADKASGCITVQPGHDRWRVKLTCSTATAGTSALFDNVRAWLNLVTNGGMEGTYTKTGSAIHTSTAATTTYDATNVYDATAWTLTNAVAGMIVEGDAGKYGFITVVGSNQLTVDAWVGGTPTDGQAASVYSAVAPNTGGEIVTGVGGLARASGLYGYAQRAYSSGVPNIYKADANGIAGLVAGTWYLLSFMAKATSGTPFLNIQGTDKWSFAYDGVATLSTSWKRCGVITRATGTGTGNLYIRGSNGADYVIDDLVVIPLSSITLTATPASEANSTENNRLRVDGGDTWTIAGANLVDAAADSITLTVVPRGWVGNNGRLQQLLDSSVTSNERLQIYKSAANNLTLSITDSAGAVKTKAMAVTSANLPAGTVATVVASWSAGTLAISLNGTPGTVDGGAGSGVLTGTPTTIYLGSDKDGASQVDAELSPEWTLARTDTANIAAAEAVQNLAGSLQRTDTANIAAAEAVQSLAGSLQRTDTANIAAAEAVQSLAGSLQRTDTAGIAATETVLMVDLPELSPGFRFTERPERFTLTERP